MITIYRLSFLLFFSFSIVVSAASFEEGKEAYLAKDYEKALSILKPLAMKGHAKAQVTLGIMYDFGHGVEKDPAMAVEWYEKAAGQGNSSVQHDLGVKYYKGLGIPQNYNKAGAWWRMAADNGVAESQYNLGLMYARGLGFEKNSGKAINWYSKAASQGHGHAQYSLGVMYSFGQDVPQDYAKGLAYFQDAAEQNIAQAQYNLAVLLENGRGADVDMVGAKKWYQKASEGGVEQATERLATLDSSPVNSQTSTSATSSESAPETSTAENEDKVVTLSNEEIKVTTTKMPSTESTEPASTKPAAADVISNPEPVPVPAKMEKLTIPETEITQNDHADSPAPTKTPPENHQVVSGTVIEQASVSQKEKQPTQPEKIAKATPEKPSKQELGTTKPATRSETHFPQSGKDLSWIKSQDPKHYALQMIAFGKEENARRYIKNLDLGGEKAIYKSSMHGRAIYKVIYGDFDNHRAALKGRRALPQKYRNAKPFPKSFKDIQKDIQE